MEVRTTGVPVIGERELRRAADILRRYKQGKHRRRGLVEAAAVAAVFG